MLLLLFLKYFNAFLLIEINAFLRTLFPELLDYDISFRLEIFDESSDQEKEKLILRRFIFTSEINSSSILLRYRTISY